MKKTVLLLVTAVVCMMCSTQKERIPPIQTMENSEGKIVIYQLLPRLFGNKTTVNKPHGTIDENGVGKFNDIDVNALKAIKDLGVTHIWFTGVIEHATVTDNTKFGIPADDADVVKGRAGSPYAIKDYYDVAPDLAVSIPKRMKEFEQLVKRTHAQGLKVIIDFIPNHVARVYKSNAKPENVKDLGALDDTTKAFSPNNNFYYLPGESFTPPKGYMPLGMNDTTVSRDGKFIEKPAKATGNDQFTASPDVNQWFETVKLNYGVDIQNRHKAYFDPIPDTWLKMKDILLYWANKDVDGFRCDMVEMVPVEFWNWVIPQIKFSNSELVFIAEVYNPAQYQNYIHTGRFTYLYDKVQLYDTLRLLTTGKGSTKAIDHIQKELSGINHNMLHFIENHDEQRVASKYFAGDAWKAAPAMVVSATIDQGPVMIYFGQEVGEPGEGAAGFQAEDGRTTIFDYWGVPAHQKWMNNGKFNGDSLAPEQKQLRLFYKELLNLASKSVALNHGVYLDLTEANIASGNFNEKILAYVRFTQEEKLLIVASFDDKEQIIKVQIPQEVVSKMELDVANNYIARDLLWHEAEVGIDRQFMFEIKVKPYSSYIFKIK